MRLTGWHVDGYGHYRDRAWSDLPRGLTVFHGPNEAGKSTLLSFLESVLFGFRDGRTKQPAIPALAGGTHGGRVFLESAGAAWTVGRSRPGGLTVSGPAGSGSEADLRRLLGNVDRELFASVFAFSLSELEDLGGLADDAFGQRLFAAGLTGVGQSAHDALAVLERRAAGQYKQKAASELKDLWDELEALKERRREARATLAGHPTLVADEAALRVAVADGEGRTATLRREDQRLERLERVWSVLSRRATLAARLDDVAGGGDVPAGVVDEVVALDTRIVEQQEALDEVTGRIARRTEARELLVVDASALSAGPTVAALQAEAAAHRERLATAADLRRESAELARRIGEAQDDVGPGWTRERATAFDASVAVRDEIDRWGAELADARRVVDAARVELDRREEQLTAAVERRRALGGPAAGTGDGAAGPTVDPDVVLAAVDRRIEALGRVRAGLDQLGEHRRDLEAAEARLQDHECSAEPPVVEPRRDGPGPALVAAGALAVVVGIVLAAVGQVAGGVATAVLGAVVLVLARGLARRAAEEAANVRDVRARASSRTDRGRVLRERRNGARERLDTTRERLLRDAVAAGLNGTADGHDDGLPTYDTVAERTRALAADREDVLQARRREDEVSAADEAVARALAGRDERAADLRDAEVAAAGVDRGWNGWRAAHDLVETAAPATVSRVVEGVLRLRGLFLDADRLDRRRRAVADELASWSDRAAGVLRAAGRVGATTAAGHQGVPTAARHQDVPTGADPSDLVLVAVARLDRDARTAAAAEAARLAADDELTTLRADRDRLGDRVGAARRRRTELLVVHGAADREELQAAARDAAERGRLAEALEELDADLRRTVGDGSDGARLLDDAREGAVEAWAARRDAIEQERRTAAAGRDDALSGLALATAAREELEASADLVSIDGRIEEVRTEAAQAVSAYRATLGAQRLIRDTLAAYVEDRQPQVLVDASARFAQLTDGRYLRIRQGAAKQETLELEDAAGRTIDPVALSRGTREQLYLCLRLALATGVAEAGTPLPLIMDDVLVNFSPDRAAAMAGVLAAVAATQQVLVFTCHPSTRDLLVRAAADYGDAAARVEELTRGGTVAPAG